MMDFGDGWSALVLVHFNHPWAVSQPCVSKAMSSMLVAAAWRGNKCFQSHRAWKEPVTGVEFLKVVEFLTALAWMHIQFHGKKTLCFAHVIFNSVTCHVMKVGLVAWLHTDGIFFEPLVTLGSLCLQEYMSDFYSVMIIIMYCMNWWMKINSEEQNYIFNFPS